MAKKKKADDDAEGDAGGGKKKIMMAVGALALGGGAYKFVLAPAPAPADPVAESAAAEATPVEGEVVELPEVVINLADPETRYARVGVALVLEEGILAKDFEAETAIAKDVVLTYLSGLSYEQLRQPQTKEQAKADLSVQIREAYGDAKVVRVLFTVLVMQ